MDLGRLKVLIEPEAEWKQMLHEAWRLQRDHFWRADMSEVDWKGVLLRYAPLVGRVNCRSEFGDLQSRALANAPIDDEPVTEEAE